MPDRLPFTKMQGVGNDFVVVDGRNKGDVDWSVLAIEICDRTIGVGADGLLVLDNTHLADFMMRMYNPDGTPDVCGNGLRCIARYAVERGIVTTDHLRIATLNGVRAAAMVRDCCENVAAVTVNMGMPRFLPSEIPMHVASDRVVDYPVKLDSGEAFVLTALSTGSTHTVAFVDELPDDSRFLEVSPQIEHHLLFPDRTSLMWCKIESDTRLRLRIWERGAGETWGCGTGACAAAVAATLRGCMDPEQPVTVASRGGELHIRWRPGDSMEMTGPAENVYEGTYRLDSSRRMETTHV